MPHNPVPCCHPVDGEALRLRRTCARDRSIFVAIAVWPIVIYRVLLSPLKRVPSCRYLPTCSEYAEVAIRKRGIVIGTMLAVWRIVRCNPLCRGGYDPVPSAGEKVHAGSR